MEVTNKLSVIEQVLRRDKAVTLIALLAISLLAWAYILAGVGMDMHSMSMPDMAMPMTSDWTAVYFAAMLAMWCFMMVAMMLPSAAPMILLYATLERRRRNTSPFWATTIFTAAYVSVWIVFSIVATLLQWQLDRLTVLSPAMTGPSIPLTASVLIAIGLYQFTPLKNACLRGCRSPLEFIMLYWGRPAFDIGLRHGVYCVGCCWMVMLLLFVGGMMNILWVALIAGFILAEKTFPRGEWLSYGGGAALICWGGWALYAHTFA